MSCPDSAAPARLGLAATFTRAWERSGRAGEDACSTWVVGLEVDAWRGWLDEALALLSGPERVRVDRLRRAGDRETHALAYACHRLLLSGLLQRPPGEVPLVRDDRGCPRLPGTAWHASLSHSDGAVMLAASRSGPVGVDLEPLCKASLMPELVERVCAPSERAALAASDGEALLALWVRKEAVLKACGLGMEVDMPAFDAPDRAWVPLPRDGRRAYLAMLPVGPRHRAALACMDPTGVTVQAWLRPMAGA